MSSSATLGRRACALLAAGSAALHAVMLGHAPNVVLAGVLTAMIVACLYCAYELWRAGSARAWVVVALMNLAMIALHLPAPNHHHHGAAASAGSTLMEVATLVAVVEVLAASVALYLRSRDLAQQAVSGTPSR